MSSEVEIVNLALTLLGSKRIASIDDDVKPAREAKAIFSMCRDALLGAYNWNFAIARAQLAALSAAPLFGYAGEFPLPQDPLCLRIVQIGDQFPGVDLVNYRGASTEEWSIEGRSILTDWSAPLNLRYVKQVTDTTQFHPCFSYALGSKLAMDLCEPLTQSDTKFNKARMQFSASIADAIKANAIELPPKQLADDSWILSRL